MRRQIIVTFFTALGCVFFICATSVAQQKEYSSYIIKKGSKVQLKGNTEKVTFSKSPLKLHVNISNDTPNALWQTAEMSIEGGPFVVDHDKGPFLVVDDSPEFKAVVSGQITWSGWRKKGTLSAKEAKVCSIGKSRFPVISCSGSLISRNGQTIDNYLKYVPENVSIELKKNVKEHKVGSVTKKTELENGMVMHTTNGVKNGHIKLIVLLLANQRVFLVPLIF